MTGPQDDEATVPLVDFSGLYQKHARDLCRFALYLSGDAALADDLVSEAFVRVWTARDRVEWPTVRGYLFTVVRNLFLRHLRSDRRRVPLDEDTIDNRPGPEDRARGHSELRIVLAALATLPEIDRAAVLMRADDGLSYEEIATALGISISAAKVKVHRARLKLAAARLAIGTQPGSRSGHHEADT
jgi:RNA polymerase sigma-70 factor (ECF subfamily)